MACEESAKVLFGSVDFLNSTTLSVRKAAYNANDKNSTATLASSNFDGTCFTIDTTNDDIYEDTGTGTGDCNDSGGVKVPQSNYDLTNNNWDFQRGFFE